MQKKGNSLTQQQTVAVLYIMSALGKTPPTSFCALISWHVV